MSHPAISVENVHLSLGAAAARVHVLRGLNVNVPRGEAVGIVGPSGSGKSTLLMTMAGLERPDRGRIVVDGTDLGPLDEDGLARFRGENIGLVFQSFHLIPNMTALENVAVPLELTGRDDPTGNLDGETGRQIIDLVFELRREHQATLVLVTHDESLAALCDRVISMRDGEIVPAPAQAGEAAE